MTPAAAQKYFAEMRFFCCELRTAWQTDPVSKNQPTTNHQITMKRFRAIFSDAGEITQWNIKAIDHEHAESCFWDSVDEFGGCEGIQLISITRATETA